MSVAEAIDSVKFVVDQEGHRTAALLDIAAWNKLIDWIEDIVDAKQAAELLTQLEQHEGRSVLVGYHGIRFANTGSTMPRSSKLV